MMTFLKRLLVTLLKMLFGKNLGLVIMLCKVTEEKVVGFMLMKMEKVISQEERNLVEHYTMPLQS